MARVQAATDIVTEHGLRIAKAGDTGEAMKGAQPYDARHNNKVLARFNDNKRAYWCDPAQLQFLDNVVLADYAARVVHFDPFERATHLPTSPRPLKYHFGKNLRLCRQARKLTQSQLGRQMSRHGLKAAQATICYREGRPYSPNGKFVEAAARVLQVPAWLFFVNIRDRATLTGVREFLVQTSSSICEAANGIQKDQVSSL
jgi:transcriptional regulator with XRE-family HTH domain